MEYLYDMHRHFYPCSACSSADLSETVKIMKEQGYAGTIVTDHFYHGNTRIDRNLPWRDFIAAYEREYLDLKEIGEREDFDILFGIEEELKEGKTGSGEGKEVLLYGITPQFLYDRPEIKHCSLKALSAMVREAGAIIIQAHPFRDRPYISDPSALLDPDLLDGFEILNGSNTSEENEKAKEYADKFGKITTSGTDAHKAVFEAVSGIISSSRIRTESELVSVLKSQNYRIYTE